MAHSAAAGETDGLLVAQVLGEAVTEPPHKRLKKAAAVVAPPAAAAKELTLEEALIPFAGLKPIQEAPEWLEGALDDDEKRLTGATSCSRAGGVGLRMRRDRPRSPVQGQLQC